MRWFAATCLGFSLCGCDGGEADVEQQRIAILLHGQNDVPMLVTSLQDDNQSIRLAAATELGRIGAPAVPAVTELLSHQDDDVRSWAISILGAIGPPASSSVPQIKSALDDAKPGMAEAAAVALSQIGGNEATQVLAAAVSHPNQRVRKQVIVYFSSAEADVAVPVFIAAMKDSEPANRKDAAVGLYAKGASPEVASAVPALREALRDENSEVRWWASHALASYKAISKPAVPDLIAGLKEPDDFVRGQFVDALAAIGPEPGVVDALIDMLDDADPHARDKAAEALGNFGPAAVSAVPALEKLRGQGPPFVQSTVKDALEKIAPTTQRSGN